MTVLDVSRPTAPVVIARPDVRGSIEAVVEDVAFVQRPPDFALWNVADPTAPVEVGAYTVPGWSGYADIAARGNYVYLTGEGQPVGVLRGIGGLKVIDVSDPTHPQELGT